MFNLSDNIRALSNSDSYKNDYLTDRLNAQRVLSLISLMIPFSLLFFFLVTPNASDLKPNPLVVYISTIIIIQAAIRLFLNWKKVLTDSYQLLCVFIDLVALSFILIAYAITYEVPLSVALKSPTANIFFIYLTSRIVLFDKSILLKTSLITTATWIGLVYFAMLDPMFEGRTSSFIEYMTSFKVLIGAEIEKILQFGLITAVLYVFLHSARHDPPTGFLRRPFFMQSLSKFLISTKSDNLNNNYAVVEVRAKNLTDVNKIYNTAFNLTWGLSFLRDLKVVKVGRLSDQSFALSIEYSKDIQDFTQILRQIYNELNANVVSRLANKSPALVVGGCIINRNLSAHQHLTYTDIAIREATASGKNFLVFDDLMLAQIEHRQSIERAIELGFKNNLFSVVYQPIIDLMTEKPMGFEALIRLKGVDNKPISPAEFIPIAESAGLINDVTEFLCDQVAIEAVAIKELFEDYGTRPYININISPSQLIDVKRIITALTRAEGSGVKINVEITESTVLNNDRVYDVFNEIRAEGFSIAIDDFGTGHSSLQRLEKFKFSTLKVDQCFVRNIHDPKSYRFLNAIINLARTAAEYTIVEGVETLEQKLLIMKMGVRYCQGYYWGRPMPITDLCQYITEDVGFEKTQDNHPIQDTHLVA